MPNTAGPLQNSFLRPWYIQFGDRPLTFSLLSGLCMRLWTWWTVLPLLWLSPFLHLIFQLWPHSVHLQLTVDVGHKVTWWHKKGHKECHVMTQEMSHDDTRNVTWRHKKCHMTTQEMSHDDSRNVTWRLKKCHMTTQEMSYPLDSCKHTLGDCMESH